MSSVVFMVKAPVQAPCFVGVVGSRAEIGEWQLQRGKTLTKDENTNFWKLQVKFDNPGQFEYRYFIGRRARTSTCKEYLVVQKWESGPAKFARTAKIPNNKIQQLDDGDFGMYKGEQCEDTGWLSGQSEVRFTFSENGEAPMISWQLPGLPTKSLSITFQASGDSPSCEARRIEPHNYLKCAADEKIPMPKGDSVLTYVTQVESLTSFDGKFTIYQDESKVLGHAGISSAQLAGSTGYQKVAILDMNHDVIGTLHMETVVIQSYKSQSLLNMKEGFGNYWLKRPTLHIGHRGSGNSFSADTPSDIYENTVESFNTASEHQAAMIEFDVQLTKDKIPIVFHDFTICTSVASKQDEEQSLHEVEVQSLTHSELMRYKLRHRTRKTKTKTPPFDEDSYQNKPFMTLREVLESVPEHTGFDIELKWPEYNLDKSYSHGVEKFCDANEFVDKILNVVFNYCKERRIFFSSFDTNICTFLRRKQNRFPIIFLMDEGSIFMDLRSRYNKLAIPFAMSENFKGICFSEDSAYSDCDFIKSVHEKGLLCLFYGDHIHQEKNRKMFEAKGADAIIYDRIHHVLPSGVNVFQQSQQP